MGCNMRDQNIGLFQQGGCTIDLTKKNWMEMSYCFVSCV